MKHTAVSRTHRVHSCLVLCTCLEDFTSTYFALSFYSGLYSNVTLMENAFYDYLIKNSTHHTFLLHIFFIASNTT